MASFVSSNQHIYQFSFANSFNFGMHYTNYTIFPNLSKKATYLEDSLKNRELFVRKLTLITESFYFIKLQFQLMNSLIKIFNFLYTIKHPAKNAFDMGSTYIMVMLMVILPLEILKNRKQYNYKISLGHLFFLPQKLKRTKVRLALLLDETE